MRDNQQSFFVDFGSMPQENEIPQQEGAPTHQLFNQALALQQQQKWDSALEAYQAIIKNNSNDLSVFQASALYHNMSTVAYAQGNFLKAYAWSKKSLALQPNNQLAKESLEQYSKKVEAPSVARHLTSYDSFKYVISKTPVDVWLSASLLLILFSCWLLVKNIIVTKKNRLANNYSNPPRWPIFLVLVITLGLGFATYVSYTDYSTPRAIVIVDKAAVQTAPGENKSVIFEAQAGLELEVLKFDRGYYQIRYPGAFSGWINSSQLEFLGSNFKQSE